MLQPKEIFHRKFYAIFLNVLSFRKEKPKLERSIARWQLKKIASSERENHMKEGCDGVLSVLIDCSKEQREGFVWEFFELPQKCEQIISNPETEFSDMKKIILIFFKASLLNVRHT
jgi:hypothetical protein